MSTPEKQSDYISKHLMTKILTKLPGEKLVDFTVEKLNGLDGFMSALYSTEVKTVHKQTNEERTHKIIVKLMKGDYTFRETSKSFIQFANEIFIYSKVLPYYEQIIDESGVTSIKVSDWVANIYAAEYGYIEGLCESPSSMAESVLAVEDLRPRGYRMGPALYLDRDHMRLMAKPLAEYHGLTYVLRIRQDIKLEEFKKEIIPLPFKSKNEDDHKKKIPTTTAQDKYKDNTNLYKVLYDIAFERFFRYFDRMKSSLLQDDNDDDVQFVENVNRLRIKYGENPTDLLERFRRIDDDNDERFAAILHGDFNRNNVLFKYEPGQDAPVDLKMIDFQELRYGTPALDLSFFMYMNMAEAIRDEFWMELLKFYHGTMYQTVRDILMATTDDANAVHESLNHYSFDKFYEHFSKYAFYGVMVCMHFLPWKCIPDEKLARVSHLFETDMNGNEFYDISLEMGGDVADQKIFDVVRHANRMGYMNAL